MTINSRPYERVRQLLRATVSRQNIFKACCIFKYTLIGAIKGYLVILDKKQLRVEWEERGVSEMMSSPSLDGYLPAGLSQNMLVRRYKYKELFTFIFNIYLTC